MLIKMVFALGVGALKCVICLSSLQCKACQHPPLNPFLDLFFFSFFFARNIPDISFHLRIVTKDSIMANHTSCNISPSQKNSSSMHNLPALLQSPQRERGREEGGTGESTSCLNKQIMPIHKGKWAFLESGRV